MMFKSERSTEKEEEDGIVIFDHDRLPEPRIKLPEEVFALTKWPLID